MTTDAPTETRAFVDRRHPPTPMLVTCVGVSRPPLSMIVAAAAKAYLAQRRGAPQCSGNFAVFSSFARCNFLPANPRRGEVFRLLCHTDQQSRLVSPCNQPQRSPDSSFLERFALFLSV